METFTSGTLTSWVGHWEGALLCWLIHVWVSELTTPGASGLQLGGLCSQTEPELTSYYCIKFDILNDTVYPPA